MHWTFPDFMSLASLLCIKSQLVKFCILIYFQHSAFIPRQHSFRNFKLNLQHARLVWSSCCWMYILCIEKSFYFPPKKYTHNLNNFVKCLTSHHCLQSPLKVKMINMHSPQGLTLMFPVHFKGDGSNDPNHSQVYYNRQDFKWPKGELNQQGGPQNVRGSDLLMLFGLMI